MYLHTRENEKYNLFTPNYRVNGEVLSVFLTYLAAFHYCKARMESDSKYPVKDVVVWFSSLHEDMYKNSENLNKCHYEGALELRDYERSLNLITDENQKKYFLDRVETIRNSWTDIRGVIHNTDFVIEAIGYAKPAATRWFDPIYTMLDLKAFRQVLELAYARGATEIIVQIPDY